MVKVLGDKFSINERELRIRGILHFRFPDDALVVRNILSFLYTNSTSACETTKWYPPSLFQHVSSSAITIISTIHHKVYVLKILIDEELEYLWNVHLVSLIFYFRLIKPVRLIVFEHKPDVTNKEIKSEMLGLHQHRPVSSRCGRTKKIYICFPNRRRERRPPSMLLYCHT
jgi:hypothetical protein